MSRSATYLALLMFFMAACDSERTTAPLPEPPMSRWTNTASVTIVGTADTLQVSCELALTPAERAKGLMYRKEPLGESAGMLFIMDTEEEHSFWMKNTYIPLDMIFISEGETIACIVENTIPLTRTSRTCGVPSRYVLEVDAGLVRKYGVQAGMPVEIRLP